MKGCRLVASVLAGSVEELRHRRDAQVDADAVELRLDGLPRPDADASMHGRRTPVVVTCRPTWEGGRYEGDENGRLRVLERALELGAEHVDVEWRASAAAAFCREHGSRVVLSMHDFDGVPVDLAARVREMLALGSGIVKVAVTPRSLSQLVDAARAVASVGASNVVFIGMGAAGFASRVLPRRFGSVWSYAGASVAPGQVPPARLRGEFRFGRVSSEARIYGVVGRPIMHSLSPAMHNAAFDALDLDAVYVPFEAVDWNDFEQMAQWLNLAGCSVTAPFKEDAYRAAAHVDEESRRVGAVNTLRRAAGDVWHGLNSDVEGLLAPLPAHVVKGRRVAVLGAGGAARAACVGLGRAGGVVSLHARRTEAAERVAAELGVAVGPFPPVSGSWDLLVNATPIGTWPNIDDSPVPAGVLAGGFVYDLVYNPERTRLLKDAEAAGCQTLGGLEMLIAQAGVQSRWWTGQEPPSGEMAAAARRRLAERTEEGSSST